MQNQIPPSRSGFPPSLLLVTGLSLLTLAPALAADYLIYVAPKDTPAFSAAEAKANGTSAFAERTLQNALDKAAQLLVQPGAHTATVLIAGGDYAGKAGLGMFTVPPIKNAQATLRITGGYADDFATRQPFRKLTRLLTNEGRNQGILNLSKQSQLAELVISGLLFDAAPSNKYDQKTNSLLKGSSRTVPLLTLELLMTDHLVIADNIFINGAQGAFEPAITPPSANTVVDITNNFFINTIKTLQIGAGIGYKNNAVKEVNLRHNTFLLNWPFNPDATSSNVSAVTLYHKDGARQLNIEDNIFAFNPGGAMQHDWPNARMPGIALKRNLFFMNAALFGKGEKDAGVLAGKFGTNAKYLLPALDTIADDFGYKVEGNVSFDPKIPVALLPLKAADSASVERKNTIMNDVNRLFGVNQDGGTVKIANYAPAMAFDVTALPTPAEEKAKPYGVQLETSWSAKAP